MVTKEAKESWRNDKAVQDNIVESWLCVDCGVNTAPSIPDGPAVRIAIRLGGSLKYEHTHECEIYSVKNALWRQAGMRPWSGCLCIGCLEKRLGRQLQPKDFDRHDKEVWADMPCTERLLNRRGWATVTVNTSDGPEEIICALKDAPKLNGSFMDKEEEEAKEAEMTFVEEDGEPVLYVVVDGKRIAKRHSGEKWISLEPGYTVTGSEPGSDYNTITVEYIGRTA
jgi:hypothetical protein